MTDNDFTWTDLRHYWNEAAQDEDERNEQRYGKKPDYDTVRIHGHPMNMAPVGEMVWIIEDNNQRVQLARKEGSFWGAFEAGDIWPCKPVAWMALERKQP